MAIAEEQMAGRDPRRGYGAIQSFRAWGGDASRHLEALEKRRGELLHSKEQVDRDLAELDKALVQLRAFLTPVPEAP